MSRRERFQTRAKANAGAKLQLWDPIKGEMSDEWLLLLGKDSDVAHKVELDLDRQVRKRLSGIDSKDKEALAKATKELEDSAPDRVREQIASLVVDWSWADEQPCTRDNVIEFLREAPQVADSIDTLTSNRALFFALAAKTSSPSQKQPSDSTDGAQEQKGPEETT